MTEQERRFPSSALPILGDGILLLCAVMGLAGSFLSLYGGPDAAQWIPSAAAWADVSVLERCADDMALFLGLSALFALVSLCVWSLPRFRGAAAGGLAGIWLLAAYLNREDALSGAALTCKEIADLFCARVDWGQTFPYERTLFLIRAAAHARLFLILALALLALVLGWAVVRARRWWLVLALTLPPLIPGLLADFYPSWPAFMALSACWCVMLLTGLCKWAVPSGRGKLTLLMFPAVALVLGLLTLLMPMEGYTRPVWALRAEQEFYSASNRASDFFSRFDGPFQSTVTYVGAAEEADLRHAGPLRYTGRTVLRVSSDYRGVLYLRGSSLAVYEDGAWKVLPEGTWQEYLDRCGDTNSLPQVFPALLAPGGKEYTVTVDNVGAVGACVYTPYFLLSQSWGELGMLPMEDSYFARRQGQWEHTMAFRQTAPDQGWAVEDWLAQPLGAYRDYVYGHYLDVPDELRDELNVIRWMMDQSISGGYVNDPVVQADRVAQYLDALCEYDTNTPAAPDGVDPVLYFLNDSHRGYCMHYASAAALLLRTMGYPTRYVSGFTAASGPGRAVTVPDRAAHAWVEVWVDGFGWYPVEVTPDAAFAWRQGGFNRPVTDPLDEPTPNREEDGPGEPTPTPAAEPSPTPGDEPPENNGGVALPLPGDGAGDAAAFVPPPWLKWAALAAGVLALAWLGQFAAKRVRARRMGGPDRNRAALVCYGYLRRLSRLGGRIDPRAVELAEKAKFSRHTLTPGELAELRAFVDRERTRVCVVLGPVQRLLMRYWWGMPTPPSTLRRVLPLGVREHDRKNDPKNPQNP